MTQSEPSHARVVIPPPLVFAAAILVGYAVNLLVPVDLLPLVAQMSAGLPIIGLSVFLSAISFRSLENSGTTAGHRVQTVVLVTWGPFRYTRNPLYVSGLLLVLGFGLLLDSIWILVLLPPAILVVHYSAVRQEEAYLLTRFGEAYQRYRESVRRWI